MRTRGPMPFSRNTWQRQTIIRIIKAGGCHLTAEEIHRRVRRGGRRIGLATVYRTLDACARAGVVEPVRVGDGAVRYGLASDHHDHLICLGCGTWDALEPCLVPSVPKRVTPGFRVTGHRLEVYGYCRACQQTTG